MSEMLVMTEVCREFGGELRPVDPSFIYKLIKRGELAEPVKVGRLSRWRKEDVAAALERMAARGKHKPRLTVRVAPAKADTEAAE